MNTSFISTQQIKDLINEQKFTSTQEIMNGMKNMFADVLEQTLQPEMNQHFGYKHAERRNDDAKMNYRNHQVVTKDAYVILGIKEVFGLWEDAGGSAKLLDGRIE